MSIENLDFNQLSLEEAESLLVRHINALSSNAARVFVPVLSEIFPRLKMESLEQARWVDVVDLFGQTLRDFEEEEEESLRIPYSLIERLDFHLSELASAYTEAAQYLRRAMDQCHLDSLSTEMIAQIAAICAKVKLAVQVVVRTSERFETLFNRGGIVVEGEGLFRWLVRCMSLSPTYFRPRPLRLLRKAREEISDEVQGLQDRYADYQRLHRAAQRSVKKLETELYQIFLSLSDEEREQFRSIYKILKIQDLNQSERLLLDCYIDPIVRKLTPRSKVLPLFEKYHEALDQALFAESRILKEEAAKGELDSESGRHTVELWLEARRHETQTLKYLIYRYREFLLRSDPDPYVNTRMGWHDRQIGPEPKSTEPLQVLARNSRQLDTLFQRMQDAVHAFEESSSELRWKATVALAGDIYSLIQTMGRQQSVDEASAIADELLVRWQGLDEVCSFDREAVSSDEFLLRKALLADNYWVLSKRPRFKELYRQHLAIRGRIESQAQRERLAAMQASLRSWKGEVRDVKDFILHVHAFLEATEARLPEAIEQLSDIEEVRKELLECVFIYHIFTERARKILCPQSVEERWDTVRQSLQRLDERFTAREQALLMGLREPDVPLM